LQNLRQLHSSSFRPTSFGARATGTLIGRLKWRPQPLAGGSVTLMLRSFGANVDDNVDLPPKIA
jgi:hypothetical protein